MPKTGNVVFNLVLLFTCSYVSYEYFEYCLAQWQFLLPSRTSLSFKKQVKKILVLIDKKLFNIKIAKLVTEI